MVWIEGLIIYYLMIYKENFMKIKKNIQPTTAAPVKSYKHDGKRVRIPTQEESIKLSAKDKQPIKKNMNMIHH